MKLSTHKGRENANSEVNELGKKLAWLKLRSNLNINTGCDCQEAGRSTKLMPLPRDARMLELHIFSSSEWLSNSLAQTHSKM